MKKRDKVSRTPKAGYRADYLGPDGYRYIDLEGQTYRADKIAWAYVHGVWPESIEHINGDLGDNRLANLRVPEGTKVHSVLQPEAPESA